MRPIVRKNLGKLSDEQGKEFYQLTNLLVINKFV